MKKKRSQVSTFKRRRVSGGSSGESEQLSVHASEPAQGSQERKYLKVRVISKKFVARSGQADIRKCTYEGPLYFEVWTSSVPQLYRTVR